MFDEGQITDDKSRQICEPLCGLFIEDDTKFETNTGMCEVVSEQKGLRLMTQSGCGALWPTLRPDL